MWRTCLAIAAGLCLLAFPGRAGEAPHRYALVIGNSDYAFGMLKNPVNDARGLSAALRDTGFDVELIEDADLAKMRAALERLRSAGRPDVTGLVYFAGHGVQYRGVDYLLPTDIRLEQPEDLADRAVSVDSVLAQMYLAGFNLNLLILDACRNNPFGGSQAAVQEGLAPVGYSPDVETLIAYSTAPGERAADGNGGNSPYAAALISALQMPGRDAYDVFRAVRRSVREATDGVQLPWVEGSVEQRFYFHAPDQQTFATLTDTDQLVTAESVYWREIRDSRNPADFDAFLTQFPDADLAKHAQERKTDLLASGEQPLPPPDLPLPTPTGQPASLHDLMTPCDLVAADPDDPARLAPGIRSGVVNSHLAIKVCAAALAKNPENPRLMFQLGRALDLAERFDFAQHFYKLAANHGYSAAITNLGYMYRTGRGYSQDYAAALKLYLAAADLGNLRARTNLGKIFEDGWGVARNFEVARQWYEIAAASGWANALDSLANIYRDGKGVAADPAEALRLYQLAADLGQSNAMNNIAILYRDGIGVEADIPEAVLWFKRAINSGNAFAPYQLARLYRDGGGIERDPTEALRLFALSADRGFAEARLASAEILASGAGVPANLEEAYFQAAVAGMVGSEKVKTKAEALLAAFAGRMTGEAVERARMRAEAWSRQNGN